MAGRHSIVLGQTPPCAENERNEAGTRRPQVKRELSATTYEANIPPAKLPSGGQAEPSDAVTLEEPPRMHFATDRDNSDFPGPADMTHRMSIIALGRAPAFDESNATSPAPVYRGLSGGESAPVYRGLAGGESAPVYRGLAGGQLKRQLSDKSQEVSTPPAKLPSGGERSVHEDQPLLNSTLRDLAQERAAREAAAAAREVRTNPPVQGSQVNDKDTIVVGSSAATGQAQAPSQFTSADPSRSAAAITPGNGGNRIMTMADVQSDDDEENRCQICKGIIFEDDDELTCWFAKKFGRNDCIQDEDGPPRRARWKRSCVQKRGKDRKGNKVKLRRGEPVVCARHEYEARFWLNAGNSGPPLKYVPLPIACFNNNEFDPRVPDDDESSDEEKPPNEEDMELDQYEQEQSRLNANAQARGTAAERANRDPALRAERGAERLASRVSNALSEKDSASSEEGSDLECMDDKPARRPQSSRSSGSYNSVWTKNSSGSGWDTGRSSSSSSVAGGASGCGGGASGSGSALLPPPVPPSAQHPPPAGPRTAPQLQPQLQLAVSGAPPRSSMLPPPPRTGMRPATQPPGQQPGAAAPGPRPGGVPPGPGRPPQPRPTAGQRPVHVPQPAGYRPQPPFRAAPPGPRPAPPPPGPRPPPPPPPVSLQEAADIDRKLWRDAAAGGWRVQRGPNYNHKYIAPDGRIFKNKEEAKRYAGLPAASGNWAAIGCL